MRAEVQDEVSGGRPSRTRRTSTRCHVAAAQALTELTAADEARIGEFLKKAVS
jgi:hypothetical protein